MHCIFSQKGFQKIIQHFGSSTGAFVRNGVLVDESSTKTPISDEGSCRGAETLNYLFENLSGLRYSAIKYIKCLLLAIQESTYKEHVYWYW